MRLTHIKLAGFKSFVDPTHIPVAGRLVGVVGPNGCGKSNVIDAVRWVLGESSARHLRGETMQDVIFNGSSERKQANRASVELVFDNSMGKAGGAWSRYAEISVKRVLERNGESFYYVNNLHVRRRDVADIFLGTGLGGRAYAIIEQGMISRIVEARPEELRTFLEEAAGISKYRERRKETEQRLEDTRENLARVDDILQELAKQLAHLESQAEVATKYRELEARLKLTQQLLWHLRRQEASANRQRLQRELAQIEVDVEAQTARLRELESRIETLRTGHYAASDHLHNVQGALYEANAEVARIEQSLQHLRDSRRRVDSQIAALSREQDDSAQQLRALDSGLTEQRAALNTANEQLDACREQEHQEAQQLPAAEQRYNASRAQVEHLTEDLGRHRQEQQVELTRRDHADKLLAQLDQRRERLRQEQMSLTDIDRGTLETLTGQLDELDVRARTRREALDEAEGALPVREQAHRVASDTAETAARELSALDARKTALELLQKQVSRSGEMHAWLDEHQLDGLGRLWQGIRIEAGWEDALEAVLRERLNAVAIEDLARARQWLQHPPPGKVSFFHKRATSSATIAGTRRRLADYVTFTDPGVAAVLEDWLERVYVVGDAAEGFDQRAELSAGELIVCPQGHVFSRNSVSFHAADSEIHGILTRQREIEALERGRQALEHQLATARSAVIESQAELEHTRSEVQRLREEVQAAQQQRHDLQLDHVRLSQHADRVSHRREQIDAELAEIEAEHERERHVHARAASRLEELTERIEEIEAQLDAAREAHAMAGRMLDARRLAAQGAARRLQEAIFHHRTLAQRIQDTESGIRSLSDKVARLNEALQAQRAELESLDEAPLQGQLGEALSRRVEREQGLARAREALEESERALKDAEAQRLECEQAIDPLRERAGEYRLKEQEARIAEENFAAQLAEANADEEALASKVEKSMRPGALQTELNRLNEEIQALGAVNLAALEELTSARERKTYLEAQSRDLHEAVETLENAIRKIDRETRERLQQTFDEVNNSLGELFPTLFGGGEAKLTMTGEEILDAGISLMARPPGKRNSSIHLLSGGEKALTALSLVFSLFRLNPAPFCLLDEVDAPLDDTNTDRFCSLVKQMSENTQFLFISHNKITMELAEQLVGITMPEQGVSRVVAVDIEQALRITEEAA
ncbi:MAG TPA: chromosome segregation protein SMC [Burkholderiales bacterium]|nr:chromosome segregation protein SMC [Burkholderiales bacterium]